MLKKRIFTLLLSVFLPATALAQDDIDILSKPVLKPILSDQQAAAEKELRAGSFTLSRAEIDSLLLSRDKTVLSLPSLDRYTGNENTPLELRRIQLHAPGSRKYLDGEAQQEKAGASERHFYIASNQKSSIGLAVDSNAGTVKGYISQAGQRMKLGGNFATRLTMEKVEPPANAAASCGNETFDMSQGSTPIDTSKLTPSASAAASGSAITYQAVIAIETDNEWLDGFGGNMNDSDNWIADMFLAMNVFFERDVEVRMLIGDVNYWAGSDPYSVPSSDGTSPKLDEFAEYWTLNNGSIDRTFVSMLSGRITSSYGFSGVAWVNQYCVKGFRQGNGRYVGSYNFNAIGSNAGAGWIATYVGHELGHNMGSRHTHCYNPPIDNCYSSESGCYSGSRSCPVGGKGTIMSYCHVSGSNGNGGTCGSNIEFHPTVQSLFESRLASQAVAGCVAYYDDSPPIPEPEVESQPVAGALLDFGEQLINTQSDPAYVQVLNTGDAALTLSCALSGNEAGSFDIESCVSSIGQGANTQLAVSCTPNQLGENQALLTVSTNDADEPSLQFGLVCDGAAPPPEPEIDTSPAVFSLLDFGSQQVGTISPAESVTVSNLGDATLTISCGLSGSGSSHFNIEACPLSITAGNSTDVEITCEPNSSGLKTAQLRINSDDDDEPTKDFDLQCQGEEPATDDRIFSSDFESGL